MDGWMNTQLGPRKRMKYKGEGKGAIGVLPARRMKAFLHGNTAKAR